MLKRADNIEVVYRAPLPRFLDGEVHLGYTRAGGLRILQVVVGGRRVDGNGRVTWLYCSNLGCAHYSPHGNAW